MHSTRKWCKGKPTGDISCGRFWYLRLSTELLWNLGVVEMYPLDPSHQSNDGGAIRVILDPLHNAQGRGAPLHIDFPLQPLGPSSSVERGDASRWVPPCRLGRAQSQTLQRSHLGPISDEWGLTCHLVVRDGDGIAGRSGDTPKYALCFATLKIIDVTTQI